MAPLVSVRVRRVECECVDEIECGGRESSCAVASTRTDTKFLTQWDRQHSVTHPMLNIERDAFVKL